MESPAPKAHAGDLSPRPPPGVGTGTEPSGWLRHGLVLVLAPTSVLCPWATALACSGIQTTSRARRTCHRVGRYVYAHQGERPPPHAPTHELAEIIAPESPPLHSASTQLQACEPETVQFRETGLDGGSSREPVPPTFHGTDMQFVTHAPTPERAVRP